MFIKTTTTVRTNPRSPGFRFLLALWRQRQDAKLKRFADVCIPPQVFPPRRADRRLTS